MSVDLPSMKDLLFPILQALAEEGAPLKRRDYASRAADKLGLSPEQRAVRIPSGKHFTFRHRAGWATNELKHAGFMQAVGGGLWEITDAGKAYLAKHQEGLSDEDIAELRRLRRERKRSEDGNDNEQHVGIGNGGDRSPEEQIDDALGVLRASITDDLLQLLGESDPGFFERVVLDVPHAMDYGMGSEALTHSSRWVDRETVASMESSPSTAWASRRSMSRPSGERATLTDRRFKASLARCRAGARASAYSLRLPDTPERPASMPPAFLTRWSSWTAGSLRPT